MLTLPNLEELTLHEPSKEQLAGISSLKSVKRLRVTHARPKDIDFIGELTNVEELVLEYVSGFSDLSPLRKLKKLKSAHFENLRRVNDFSGLSGLDSLRYLKIAGTFDWKQPIKDFEFLHGLPNLEVLAFGSVINKSPFPAFLPALSLKRLVKIRAASNMFDIKEYALLSVMFEGIAGADWGAHVCRPYSFIPLPDNDVRYHLPEALLREKHPDVLITYEGVRKVQNPDDIWFDLTGKGAGRVKKGSTNCDEKCAQHARLFQSLKDEARSLIATQK